MMISSTEQLPDQIGQEFDIDMKAPLTFGLFCELNKRLWRVAIPAIMSQLVIIMIETTSMIFIGQLNDPNAIAGVGLAIIYVNGTTTSVLMGLNGALAVLVAIAYGRNEIDDCERILNRGRVICFLASIPLFFVQISCYPVMRAFGIEPEVATHTAKYGFFLFIAMVLYCQFDCYRGYLNALG